MKEKDFNALSYEDQCAWVAESLRRDGYPASERATAPQAPGATAAPVDRVRAIIEAPEAIGREQTARHLAFNTGLAVADAVAMLRTLPDPNQKAPGPVMSENELWAATVAALNGKRPFPEGYDPPARTAPVGPAEPQQAVVAVYPPAAMPQTADKGKPAWGNVLAKLNERAP